MGGWMRGGVAWLRLAAAAADGGGGRWGCSQERG